MNIQDFRLVQRTGTMAALLVLAVSAGCSTSKPDSVVVGAIADDYRTNHPIMIGERERKIDLPVSRTDRAATQTQRVALEGFMSPYDRRAQAPVSLIVPVGSANEVAAANVAQDLSRLLAKSGIPQQRIMIANYRADPRETAAPIRISYMAMKASTNKCGRWPADLMDTAQNKHYANFGCSYQNNLAAQVANPADLLGPRKMTPIDAENRSYAIDRYKRGSDFFNSEVDY